MFKLSALIAVIVAIAQVNAEVALTVLNYAGNDCKGTIKTITLANYPTKMCSEYTAAFGQCIPGDKAANVSSLITGCVATRQTTLTLPSQAPNGSYWQTIASYSNCDDQYPNTIVGFPFNNNVCTKIDANDDLAGQYGASAGGALLISCQPMTNIVAVKAYASDTCTGTSAAALTPKNCTQPSKAAFGCVQQGFVKEVPTTIVPTATKTATVAPTVQPVATTVASGAGALVAGLCALLAFL